MIFRFISIFLIAVLTTLVVKPAQAVTWTCYESSTSYWTMEQPEGYSPSWADCEAWRYGPPDEQSPEPDAEPETSASETPLPDATEPSEPATDDSDTETEEPSSEPVQEEQSPEPTPSPTPSSTEQPSPQPTQPSSPAPSQPDTPLTTESPEEPQSPKPQPSQSIPQTEPEPQLPVQPLVEDVEDTLIEPVVESSKNPSHQDHSQTPNPLLLVSNAFFDGILSISLPASVQQVFEAVGQTVQALADSLPESITNLGSDLSPENRKEAQQVVLAAIIIPQLAASITRRIK